MNNAKTTARKPRGTYCPRGQQKSTSLLTKNLHNLLARTVRCRHCSATFRPETAEYYRARHERDFHNDV